jgi:type I restriction enzyme S subunit
MQISTKNKVVPKLRFGEFQDDWGSRLLNEVSIITTGSTPSTSKKEYYDGQRLFVSPADINDNRFVVTTKNTLTELGFKKGRILEKGSVLFVCIGSTIGKTAQVFEECISNQQINALTANSNNSNDFIFSLLSLKAKKIKRLAGVQAVPLLNKTDFSKLKFYFPSLTEQQKIASFLSSVDEKLEQLTKKKELLSAYKKGVMQKIFSQELRFKDDNGNNYPDWEEKRLGEVLKYYDGTHQTPKYVEKGVPFYSVEHLTANQFTKTKFISEAIFEKENRRVKLEKGDILMTRIGDIGTSRLIDWDVNASFYVSLALLKQNASFDSAYLQQYISSVHFQKELWSRTIHVAFPKKINLGEIGKCKALFPDLKEQQKIANFLSSLDSKIDLVNTQIENTKAFKKGLLQQMFV